MNIENTQIPVETTKTQIKAKYTTEDIVELIRKDLETKGYKMIGKGVLFETTYKHMTDDWGMGGHVVTLLNGATAIIESSQL